MKSWRTYFLFFVLLAGGFNGHGDDLRKILRLLEKHDFVQAIEVIRNDLKKEPVNPGTKWIYSRLLSADSLEYYHLDSARQMIGEALTDYDSVDENYLSGFEKLGFGHADLVQTYDEIRKQYWEKTLREETKQAFEAFMAFYPNEEEYGDAVKRRDSIEYNVALQMDSWQAFLGFMDHYPTSFYYDSATAHYEKLLYTDMVKKGTLESYTSFVTKYPRSPYVDHAISSIFKLRVLSHAAEDLTEFVKKYPSSPETIQALNLLFHMDKHAFFENPVSSVHPAMDSLVNVANRDVPSLVPLLRDGKIGFVDMLGNTVVPFVFDELSDKEASCRAYSYDFIAGKIAGRQMVVNRSLELILVEDHESVRDLGRGVLFIKKANTGKLIHKSGFPIIDNVEDAELFDNRWYKVMRKGFWGLVAYNGSLLTDFKYDAIRKAGRFWIFTKGEKLAVSTLPLLIAEAGEGGFSLEFKYDDVELVNDSLMIGFNADMESLFDDRMKIRVPWGKHEVYPDPKVFYTREGGRFYLHNEDIARQLGANEFNSIQANQRWLAVKEKEWKLYSLSTSEVYLTADSVKLISDFGAYYHSGDTARLLFGPSQGVNVLPKQSIQGMYYRREGQFSSYILIDNEGIKSVWDQKGRFLFQGLFSDVRCFSDSLFLVQNDQKTGLIDADGYYLIEPVYDFIQEKGSLAILLRKGSFGLFDLETGAEIPVEYESPFEKIGIYYKTRKEGYYGLVDENGKVATPFSYKEINYATDSLIWVQSDGLWQLVQIGNESKKVLSGVQSYKAFIHGQKTFFILTTPGGYGVYDSEEGLIINPVYSDIRMMGSGPSFLFIAEFYFADAPYYIWVGYSPSRGKLFTHAYRPEEYAHLICD
ncbi:MAG: WG repeat-containing protein [Cyclobacteriaceae bacterium]|nr:WG repeat-containing protein [Cyclobacteriaceae bacterium]